MKQAARTEHARRSAAAAAASTTTTSDPKRSMSSSAITDGNEAKRIKLDPGAVAGPSRITAAVAGGSTSSSSSSHPPPDMAAAAPNPLANFNFQDLPASLVTDLIVANLRHVSDSALTAAIAVSTMQFF